MPKKAKTVKKGESSSPVPWHWWSETKDRPKKYDLDKLIDADGESVLTYYSNGDLTPNKKLIRDAVNNYAALKSKVKQLETENNQLRSNNRRMGIALANMSKEAGRLSRYKLRHHQCTAKQEAP